MRYSDMTDNPNTQNTSIAANIIHLGYVLLHPLERTHSIHVPNAGSVNRPLVVAIEKRPGRSLTVGYLTRPLDNR